MTPNEMYDLLGGKNTNGLLAGGCVRDYLNNKPIKDWDFYVSIDDLHKIQDSLKINGVSFNLMNLPKLEDCEDYIHGYIRERYSASIKGNDVDIIVLDEGIPPHHIIGEFDFGICMVGFDRNGLIITPQYKKDVKNQTITRYRTSWGQDGCNRHLKRIQQKYPWPERIEDKSL